MCGFTAKKRGYIESLAGIVLCALALPFLVTPAASQTQIAQTIPSQVESYPLTEDSRNVIEAWPARFANRADVRIAVDERTQQALVVAPGNVHDELKTELAQGQQQLSQQAEAPSISSKLRRLSAGTLRQRLQAALGRPLVVHRDGSQQWLQIVVEPGPTAVSVWVNEQSGEWRVQGPTVRAADWRQVIAALDSAPARERDMTQLVSTSAQNRPQVRQVVQALLTSQQQPVEDEQLEAEAQSEEQPGDIAGLVGEVEIDYIEGLDLLIIQGNEEDVARVEEIIRQIERASRTAVPEIRVVYLKHVDDGAMARLLQRVYTDVLQKATGSVHITPLGRPNALLLIGRRENVGMAIELIKQLDKPVEGLTKFEVYHLQHAAVVDVKPMVDQFLSQQQAQVIDPSLPPLGGRGFAVADFRTNSIIVSASPQVLAEVGALIKQVDVAGTEVREQIRIFPLQNTLAPELAEVLREAVAGQGADAQSSAGGDGRSTGARSLALELLSIDTLTGQHVSSGVLSGVRITADAQTNSLVVTAPPESMELIAALIQQLDTAPDVEAEVKVFTMTNGSAESLSQTLSQLFGTDEDTDEQGGFTGGEGGLVRLQISVDRRTNSIIVAGTQADLEVVEAILLRLDSGDVQDRVTEVYRLNNAFAENVAQSLQAWLESRRDAELQADVPYSPFEQIEREVIVVPEAASNALIVSATPRYINELRRVIRELDERPPMVMIQVLIAEVRLNDTDEFGVELGLQDSLLFDRSVVGVQDFQTITNSEITTTAGNATQSSITEQIIINSPLNPGFNFNNSPQGPLGTNGNAAALAGAGTVAAQGLSNFALNRVNDNLGFSGLVLSASSNAVSALLRALQENRRLEVLSRPQIMAVDGQPGRVQVGEEVPIIQGTSVSQFGFQQNAINYEPVGLILEVLPIISPDGLVVMQVTAEKSRLGDPSEGVPVSIVDGQPINAPIIEKTAAYTTVSAMSGQTIVLGGLLTKETFDVHRRIPIIADIPLLGDMFRYDRVSEQRTELLIILTPRIVRDKYEAEMLKQVESSRMSWVLCDVVQMNGPSGLRSRCDEWYADEAESIFPTYIPADIEAMPLEGEILPLPPEQMPMEGPQLESAAPRLERLGNQQEPLVDPNVQPTAFVSPTRLPSPR